ncbi:uncharacterized protein L201_004279 [Kwoniella dendrophila CBS 6074]|uniref:SET domain-containing protein n=1 Tax=Kwoniella dendrophila CBS 6074 TaxID=1295534 RepID=A0AAX4JVJ3_9TREE
MSVRKGNDEPPPPNWPSGIIYLNKSRISPTFPKEIISFISPLSTKSRYETKPIKHPSSTIQIKKIDIQGHPAKGQYGLFAKNKIKPNTLIIPYLGLIHFSLTIDQEYQNEIDHDQSLLDKGEEEEDIMKDDIIKRQQYDDSEHESSDYDLSLLRISSSDIQNPWKGKYHISIGIDASKMGNSARFVNDYRGIPGISKPNAEFRLGKGENGDLRMEIWSLNEKQIDSKGIQKGQEILISYGKSWWGARKG